MSPLFHSAALPRQGYAYIACGRNEAQLVSSNTKETVYMSRGYVWSFGDYTTDLPAKVTCSDCKQTWEYIEAYIEEDSTL